jgi:hypothetical protein
VFCRELKVFVASMRRLRWIGGREAYVSGRRPECGGGALTISQRFPSPRDIWQHVIGPSKMVH